MSGNNENDKEIGLQGTQTPNQLAIAQSYTTPVRLDKDIDGGGKTEYFIPANAVLGLDQGIEPTWTGAHTFSQPVTLSYNIGSAPDSAAASKQYVIDTVSALPTHVAWGAITGILTDQADLQSALDAKATTTALNNHINEIGSPGAHLPSGGTQGQVPIRGEGDAVVWGDISGGSVNATWGSITGTLSNQADLQTALDAKASETDLTAHTSDTNNPHAVTKVQIGLDNVTNDTQVKLTDKASEADAEGGTDDTKWMTPLKTAQAIKALANDGGNGTATSGTYSPNIYGTDNMSSATAQGPFLYWRVGDLVTVSGTVSVTGGSSGNSFAFISLPVATTLSGPTDISGLGIGRKTNGDEYLTRLASINGENYENAALLTVTVPDGGGEYDNYSYYVTFTYIVRASKELRATSALDGNTATSGTYTPTLTPVDFVSTASIKGPFFYTRVGNIVTVSGAVSVTATSGGGNAFLFLSLPVPTTISAPTDVCGFGLGQDASGDPLIKNLASIDSDDYDNVAQMTVTAPNSDEYVYRVTFTYIVR
ncbi:hypothetical protein M1D80_00795 (plasmid) [Phyllobacteriaceae bacterium JZ32]